MNPTKNLRHTHGLLLAAALLSCHAPAIAQRHLAEVGADCSSLEYHLRLAPLKNTDSRCSLIWNYTDSANFRALRYTIPSLSSSDNLAGFESQYELIEYKDGAETIVAAGSFRDSYTSHPALSAMLRVLPSSACVDIGSGKAAVSIPIVYSHENSCTGYACSHQLQELRNDITASRTALPEKSQFQSLDSLRSHISASKDAYEAFWIYLDRDTNISKAVPGGRYTLATISDGRGAYDIIYIDGIDKGNSRWQPFTIKGQLQPTIFADHFNLHWLDNNGLVADKEANATIEIQGTVLKLTFPMLKSSMRFSRVPK